MKNIAIGVIGAGLIGRKHLAKLAGRDDYDLVGIADVMSIGSPRTPQGAGLRGLPSVARRSAARGRDHRFDQSAYAETGIECARRGIDILIEKPVTDTVEPAAALIAEVRKSGIKSLVGHHRRHHLQVKTLKALLGEGRIGDIVGVSAIWATHKPADYFQTAPWRTEAGGGPILINLIHEIDFLRFTIGEIVAVEAIASKRQRGFAVEDTAAALIDSTMARWARFSSATARSLPGRWSRAWGRRRNSRSADKAATA